MEGFQLTSEPTLLSAAWRHRWLVVVITGFVVALGLIFLLLRPQVEEFQAEATVVIQEPVTTEEVFVGQRSNLQFVASQVEIMHSPVVAQEAANLLAEQGYEVTGDEILGSVNTLSSPESPLVSIIARHTDPRLAVAIANNVAEGYRQVSQRQATATANSRLARVDAQIEGIDERLQEITEERRQLQQADPALSLIDEQAMEAVELIAQLQEELAEASGDEAAAIRQNIQDLRNRISVFEQVIASPIGPEFQALDEEEARQVERRAQLLTLRDEIAVDAELAPDALALVQPAVAATRLVGIGSSRVLAVSLVLGLLAGVGVAYFLSTWRRVFTSRQEPEALLGAPMLADVPDFEQESLESVVPVRDHPRSAAAEAYRFAASSLESVARNQGVSSVFVVSATLGQGKTTALVNVAIASAIHGASVMVLDCDFGNQSTTRHLIGEGHAGLAGITDVIEGVSVEDASHVVDFGEGVHLSLMPRGARPGLAASALQSVRARELFARLAASFDLVFIDGPPLLQVAYASTLAELADGLVVVVEHQGSYSQVVDLTDRIALSGTPVLGYIYNRSPLRREMTMSEGSMMDILGDSGLIDTPSRREAARRR